MSKASAREGVPLAATSLTGGLDTKSPSTHLPLGTSPDLLNVVLPNRSVEKRGGFTPHLMQTPRMNSLRNRGWVAEARASTGSGTKNSKALIVPGLGIAGHREVYNRIKDAFTVEFFFSPANLDIGEHMGNGDPGGPAQPPGGPAPYTIQVRPILSKGPLKKTADTVASPDAGSWDTAAANVWGRGALDGMPFCFYLYNVGTGSAPYWELRLSSHVKLSGGTWRLVTASLVGFEILEGATYHVIGSFDSGSEIRLRAARIPDQQHGRFFPSYSTDTESLNASEELPTSSSAIQVFDCPQQFIEADALGSSTLRPGLALDAGAGNPGGYFFRSKRFEGRIEDIAIWSGDKLDASLSALDRTTKLVPEDQDSTLVSLWSMDRDGSQIVKEVAGSANPIYLVPSGPIYTEGIGASPTGSWWFNGLTSYAQAQLKDNPNWRTVTAGGTQDAILTSLVKENRPHGIEVSFWLDSVEPQFESVVAEIYGVMRVVVDTDGTIGVYARNPTGTGYQTKTNSTTKVVPGRRYQVIAFRSNGGQNCEIFINGKRDFQGSVWTAAGADGNPIGGLIWGMGTYEFNLDVTGGVGAGDEDRINTDHRSGFCGIIESSRVVIGEVVIDRADPTSSGLVPVYKDETNDDSRFDTSQNWRNLNGTRTVIQPADTNDTVYSLGGSDGVGAGIEIEGHQEDAYEVRYDVDASSPTTYTLNLSTKTSAEGGHTDYYHHAGKVWHVLMRWVFAIPDTDVNYAGAYIESIQVRDDGAGSNKDSPRYVHFDKTQAVEKTGTGGAIVKCCIESDAMTEVWANMSARVWTHRMRPYEVRSPKELAPRFDIGLAVPAPDRNPITLLHDWRHEPTGERFLVIGAGRQIYWGKPVWRSGTPFEGEVGKLSPWLFGQPGEHILVGHGGSAQELTLGASANTVTWEAWIRPERLDGRRVLAWKDADIFAANFAIWIEDGSLVLAGTYSNATRAWRFDSSAGNGIPETFLKVRQWNHVHVTLGDHSGVVTASIHINGLPVPIVALWDAFSDTDKGTSPNNMLWIGGTPHGRRSFQWNTNAAGAVTLSYESFAGQICEVRMTDSYDATNFPRDGIGKVPRSRYTDDSTTWLLLHMDEGSGWGWSNAASNAAAGSNAESGICELIPIATGLAEESSDAPYRAVAFRDNLYVTNGKSDPLEIRFRSFSDPRGPFVAVRAGMQAPANPIGWLSRDPITSGGTALSDGVYTIWMSFVDELGRESEPTLLHSFTLSGGTANPHGFHLGNLPRSPDPQVTGRQFYMSPDGGGTAVRFKLLRDNQSRDYELFGTPSTGNLAVETGQRLPAPKARFIAVSDYMLVLGHLSEGTSGSSAIAWSQPATQTYFPAAQVAAIDSGDGDPILGMFPHLGRLYLTKRRSIWISDLQNLLTAGPQLVNDAAGMAGAEAWDNLVYGIGESGAYVFDGAVAKYASTALERFWRGVDRSDEALGRVWSGYYHADRQLWISVRMQGKARNDTLLVLHTDVPDPETERLPWTLCRVLDHSYLAAITFRDAPLLVLGTTSGQVLRYDTSKSMDGTDAPFQITGSTVLTGTAVSTTATSLTIGSTIPDGEFPTIHDGLRGCKVEIVDGSTTYTRTITRNTTDTIYWDDPITFGSLPTFTIGGFEAYWTTGWIAPQRFGQFLHVEATDFEFEPKTGKLDTWLRTITGVRSVDRTFDTSGAELVQVDMSKGWHQDRLRIRSETRGRYARLRFGTSGINREFSVSRFGIRWTETGQAVGRSAGS